MAGIEPTDPSDTAGAACAGPAARGRLRLRRLLVRRDFLRVAARQVKAVTPGLILQAAPTPQPPPEGSAVKGGPEAAGTLARVGFTVSRKVGNAVARNRARRRLRAAVEAILPEVAQPGVDYVVIGRAGTLDRPYAELLNDLRSAVRRVGSATRSATSGAGKGGAANSKGHTPAARPDAQGEKR